MQHLSKFHSLISEAYSDAFRVCKSKYRGSDLIYGMQFDDLFQQAVETLLSRVKTICEEREDCDIKPRLNLSYIQNALIRNFDDQVAMAARRHGPRSRPTTINWIKEQYYPDNQSEGDFEGVEVDQLFKVLKGKTRSFLRMLTRDNLTVRDICRKLDLSTRQYYKAKQNVKRLLERHGFEQKEA